LNLARDGVRSVPIVRSARAIAALVAALAVALLAPACRDESAPHAPAAARAAAPARARPNILLVTLDTTRRDAMGFLGRSPSITPRLDALAAESVVFTDAYTVTPLTLPAHTSLMTGLYPNSHHLRDNSVAALPASATTLAEVLADGGWKTAAGVAAIVLDSSFGLDQGFATYRDPPRDPGRQRLFLTEMRGDAMVDQALRDLPAAGPWFYWLHLFDAHYPYAAPGSVARPVRTEAEGWAEKRRLYFEEIAYVDQQLGRLLFALRERPDWEETIVVVAADHGESLLDGVEPTHGWFLYDATVRVPLLIRVPGAAPRRVATTVSLVDVMPTVLELAGVARADLRFDGTSVADLVRGGDEGDERFAARAIAAESWYAWSNFGWAPMEACVQEGFKLVRSRKERLFDRRDGAAGEKSDVRDANVPRATAMRARLDRWAAEPTAPQDAQGVLLDEAGREELRKLGYVDATVRDFATRPDFATLDDPEDHADVVFVLEQVTSAFSDGDPAAAAAHLRRLLILAPQSVFAHEQLGAFLIAGGKKGDWDEAESHLRRAIELDYQRSKAHYNLGLLLMRRMNGEKEPAKARPFRLGALEEFRRAIEVDSNSPEALANLATLLRMEADALPPAEKAARLALYDETLAVSDRFLRELPADHADRGRFIEFRAATESARKAAAGE